MRRSFASVVFVAAFAFFIATPGSALPPDGSWFRWLAPLGRIFAIFGQDGVITDPNGRPEVHVPAAPATRAHEAGERGAEGLGARRVQ